MQELAKLELSKNPKCWLVTGCAGFIGSNLCEYLLSENQQVIGVDSLITGKRENLDDLQTTLTPEQKERFSFFEDDLLTVDSCKKFIEPADYILHQAALGSVPRSIKKPADSHRNNVDTFANMLFAMQEVGGKRMVYASSSSVYGDHPDLPKVEDKVGHLLSPYALTKKSNEDFASTFSRVYGFELIGLRYFNVFGRRQNPDGAYSAVIPRWIRALIKNDPVHINGDGETSRDFTPVDNVIEINIKAALTSNTEALNKVYNVALGGQLSLNELYKTLKELLSEKFEHLKNHEAIYQEFREGDIRHSLADISQAKSLLGFNPQVSVKQGLEKTLEWYVKTLS